MAVFFGSSVEVGKSDSVEFAGNRRLSSNYAWDITASRNAFACFLISATQALRFCRDSAMLGLIALSRQNLFFC